MKAAVRTAAVLLSACGLLATATVTAPIAQAQTSFDDARVDFGGIDGRTETVRAVGDQVWVGGVFTEAVDADLTTTHPRSNVAVFDFNTGDVRPIIVDTNATVRAIESDDSSHIWVAGSFTEIAGQPQQYIAAFDAYTGAFDPGFSVVVDNEITTLKYDNGWLYIGGEFSSVNGLLYEKVARVEASTGALDTNFRANPDNSVTSIDTYEDTVYIAGYFDEVGNAPDNYARRWITGLDAETGQPSGAEFFLPPLSPIEGPFKAGVTKVHVSPDGNYLYTGDQRNWVRQWNRLTGEQLWQRRADGDIQTILALEDTVYVGTHDGFLVPDDQRLLFALNVTDGSNDETFLPLQDSFYGTLDIAASQGALLVVGDFTTIQGVPSPHLAIFHGPDWNGATPLTPPLLPGDVTCNQQLSVQDAVFIAQFGVGLRTQATGCDQFDPATQIGPGGDVNGDGRISVADAVLVAQCSVGLPNMFCPE